MEVFVWVRGFNSLVGLSRELKKTNSMPAGPAPIEPVRFPISFPNLIGRIGFNR